MAIMPILGTEKLTATVSLPPPWAICAWHRVNTTSGIHPGITLSETSGDTQPQALLGNAQGNFIGTRFVDDTGAIWTIGNSFVSSLDFERWAFICASNDGAGNVVSAAAFADISYGTWDAFQTQAVTGAITLGYLSIGDDPQAHGWVGAVEEVRIWSRALTLADFMGERFYSTPLNLPGLYAYYPLTDPGSYLTDFSGNGHTLTASGTVRFCGGGAPRRGKDPVKWAVA